MTYNTIRSHSQFNRGRSGLSAALLCGVAVLAALPQTAVAQSEPIVVPEGEMTDLGSLGGEYGYAYDVSDNGGVVIGESYVSSDEMGTIYHGFRWTDQGGMEDLGTLGGDYAYARAVSGDGNTIVGNSYLADNNAREAFRWTEQEGMVSLGTLGGTYSYSSAISVDGSVIVGQSTSDQADSYYHAFRWTAATGMVDLGTLGGVRSYASAVSGDGSIVVGQAEVLANNNQHAFRWTEAGGMQDLGTFGGLYSYAYAISRDGSTVVGQADNDANIDRAFRWTETGGLEDLGSLDEGTSRAIAVSNDGKSIAGNARVLIGETDSSNHAFLWTEADGMQDLGTLGGNFSYGEDISGDGKVVAGQSELASVGEEGSLYHAFRWTAEDGMQDLGTLGGNRSYVYAISNDGTTIVGESNNADNIWRPFIYRSQMQDFTNILGSFPLLAADIDAIGEAQRDTLSQMIGNSCVIAEGKRFCVGLNAGFGGAGRDTAQRFAKREDSYLQATLGARLSSSLEVGIGIGLTNQDKPFFTSRADDGVSFTGWIDFAPGGASRIGPKARLAIGNSNEDFDTVRGFGLENVEMLAGSSDLETRMVSGTAGYGFAAGPAVLTPFVGLSWQRTKLGAFDEADGDYPASFGLTEWETSYATLGAEAAFAAGPATWLTLTGMVDFELQSDAVVLAGMSEIPGMESFAITSPRARNDTRGRIEAGITHQLGPVSLSVTGTYRTSVLDGPDSFMVGIGLGTSL